MPYQNKVVIVTGGASGIGKAICKRIAKDGYFVLINYNSNELAAQELQTEIVKKGGVAATVQFNIKNKIESETQLNQFFNNHPHLILYGLINNAGITRD